MLLESYSPATSDDIIGNRNPVNDIKRWLSSWKKGALLVHGPAGTGKTTAIRLIAKENGYELLEVHADETFPDLTQAGSQRSIFSNKKLILVENAGTAQMRKIVKLTESSMHPVICVAADAYKIPPASRRKFRLVKFEKIKDAEMSGFARKVCEAEGIDDKHAGQIARMSSGDVRSLLIDLEMLRLGIPAREIGYRNSEDNIFSTVRIIFKTASIENSRIAMERSEKNAEEIFWWIENNVADEYTDAESIASAYDYLSRADIFSSRVIKRQSWALQKYFSALAVYGTSLSKKKPSARFVPYRPPFMVRRSRTAMKKIAGKLHTNTATAPDYVPIIRRLAKKHDVAKAFELDDKEAAFVIG